MGKSATKIAENATYSHRFCVAPMMEWTDRHCRFFHRLLTRRARLYTEMITTAAVLRGDRARLLAFDPAEHPLALQLGGCDPRALAQCARIAEDAGYDEVNLNIGCPSDRVQEGRFGACLMAEPKLVGDGVAAMKAAISIPVTVKCRLGIDDQDPEESLEALTSQLKSAGVDALIVHARKAWLQGLSPRDNRAVPPLDHARVHRLKQSHPDLPIVINGGIGSLEAAARHLQFVDGVMMARAAYQEPWRLLAVDPALFGQPITLTATVAISGGGAGTPMGLATFISVRSQTEFYLSEIERERDEIRRWPEREREEVRGIYRKKGFSGQLLDQIVSHITAKPERWADVMMREELGFTTDSFPAPLKSGLVVGTSYLLGAAVPVIPYAIAHPPVSIVISAILTVLALFVVGASKTVVTTCSWWRGGLESMLTGAVAAAVTYGAGRLFATR